MPEITTTEIIVKDIKKDYPKKVEEDSKQYITRLVKEVFNKDLDQAWLERRPPK